MPNLTYLNCSRNPLTSIDVSKNTALIKLCCANCELETLDVRNNTELQELQCHNYNIGVIGQTSNNLTSLDLSKNPKLTTLFCEDNFYNITLDEQNSFDLSKLPGDFDVTKTSNWSEGATVSGTVLKISSPRPWKVTYDYDLGNGEKATFKLNLTYHSHGYDDLKYDENYHWQECGCGERGSLTQHTSYDNWKADGDIHYKECYICKYKMVEKHEIEVVNAKEATVFKPGYTGDKVCKKCNHTVEQGKEIPATGFGIDISGAVEDIKDFFEQIDPEIVDDIKEQIKDVIENVDPEEVADIVGQIKDIIADIDPEVVEGITEQVKDTLDKLIDVLVSIFDSEGLVPSDPDKDPESDSSTGETDSDTPNNPDEDASIGNSNESIPNTGAAAGITAFAALSVAAAAAFVSRKKKY